MRVRPWARSSNVDPFDASSGWSWALRFTELGKLDRMGWKPAGAAKVVMGVDVTVTVLELVMLESSVDVVVIVLVFVTVSENVSVS
jgi:hypothetical protein